MADRDMDLAVAFFNALDFRALEDGRFADAHRDLAALLASERAAATAACAEIAAEYTDPRELRGAASRECALLAGEIEGRIRALSPDGWVGVRRDTLADLRVLAEVVLRVRDEGGARYSPTDDFVADLRAALEATR